MPDTVTHLYFLLDRSGSMSAIADAVVEGFNDFLAEQQQDGPDALMTLVQFDSQDPFELVADAVPIREMIPLDAQAFEPRGGTPLLDSLGKVIGRATSRADHRAAPGEPAEDVLVAVFTDGRENASEEFTRSEILELITKHETDDDWTFAYLGANQDAFAESGGVGIQAANAASWDASQAGARVAMSSLSASVSRRRASTRADGPRQGLFEEENETDSE
jgi:hypothetical protein